ncbi:MAG: nitrilase-related carbon-nitrogen hydrolase, partial [Gammaproteobacteria bacterium]
MSKKTAKLDRRSLITGAAMASLAAAAGSTESNNADAQNAAAPAGGAAAPGNGIQVSNRGQYAKVALKQDFVNVAAVQSQLYSIEVRDRANTLKRNLNRILRLIDLAQNSPEEWGGERRWGSKVDLISMHEFPIQGFQPWTRKELNQVAFELPGPESEAIGERAKRYGCYISWGCYAKEKDWPDHVINMSVLTGPDGKIVSKQWKA